MGCLLLGYFGMMWLRWLGWCRMYYCFCCVFFGVVLLCMVVVFGCWLVLL